VLKGRSTIPLWATVAVAVMNLVAGAAAVWVGLGWGPGPRAWIGPIAAGVCCLAAVGTLALGWRARAFQRAVTSTVEGLRRGEAAMAGGSPGADEVTWAIRDVVDHCRQAARGLQGQLDDLRLRTGILERQKRHTEAILHSLHDPVIVVDEFDHVLLAKRAAEQVLGFSCDQAQEGALADWLGPDHQELMEFLRQSRKGKGDAIRRQIEWADARVHATYDCVTCCVRNEQGSDCGVVMVLHDVTRDKEVSQIKNDFVSYVSHELKTPLASITAYAEMLLDGEADDEPTRREFVAVIHGQAKRLNRLIEDILNISRIESGVMPVRKAPLSLALLMEEQIQMIRSFAEERHVQILGSKPIVCDQVLADRDMMTLVIVNLLSNAVKYNKPEGSITIETEVDEIESVVRVRVTDTGVGIPPDEAEHLFEKFYRAPANARRAEGTGLGLNLVKQIVERLHGGRVFVESQVGVGSVFGFELPLASGQTADAAGVRLRG
jgi:two-component system, OmpR family, phosphate regulon sensor histidine kinase PhoR